MCGISGFFDSSLQTGESDLRSAAARMAEAVRHRGPDDSGVWTDAPCGIAFSHRRLSILDLSPSGHQPMISSDGRFVIIFNGEIYNFRDLRSDLEKSGHTFRGHSDTEVMLAAISQWGLEAALKRFVGMFAFALWDRQERTLHLARDRMGEKPLYYGWSGAAFLFGSELKALRAHPLWQGEIDRDALALFLRHNYIPAPRSIYRGIFKLTPGTVLSLSTTSAKPGTLPSPVPFWSMKTVAEAGESFAGTESEAVDSLEKLLKRAVAQQMVADVPLGAFLSGGVDSSTIVALMQAQSSRPIKTFTIGFHEAGYNEAEFAKDVARHLGTEHTELYVTPEEAMAVIPRLPTIYDEPFSDSSQIPTVLVAQMTRRHVTVSLSGDAGDELFAGYPRYPLAQKIWNRIGRAPRVGRSALAWCLRSVEAETWDSGLGWLAKVSPESLWAGRVGDRLHKLADILSMDTPELVYR
ncbi:MAG: asparagine synthase (glutamine-hydrolyzing), partial [Verrucomicrobia bacterium]